jgi:site-specific recombinase XerD
MNEIQKQRLNLLIERFDEWLGAINFLPSTRRNYKKDVREFFEWIEENTTLCSVSEVTPAHIQQYQVVLYNYERPEKGRLAVSTQAGRLGAIKKFFNYLVDSQHMAYNPASNIKFPNRHKKLPQVLTKKEARRVVEAIPIDGKRNIRNRAILEILYSTGIRVSELINLALYDLDLEKETLTIRHGKGERMRVMPLVESAKEVLKLYLEKSRELFFKKVSNRGYLFISTKSSGRLNQTDIRTIVHNATRLAKINKHVTPHTLRHSIATHLLKGKADIRQIQRFLGHSSVKSTEIYTHVEVTDLRQVLARCHPREKKR